jgi:hypothetical protein
MNQRPASLVAAILLWLIALAQLLRVLLRVEVKAGDVNIPLWVSVLPSSSWRRWEPGFGASGESSAGQTRLDSPKTLKSSSLPPPLSDPSHETRA